jgi:hypothetical protein
MDLDTLRNVQQQLESLAVGLRDEKISRGIRVGGGLVKDLLTQRARELIFTTISDLVQDFIYYDRKNDEELGVDEIEQAIRSRIISIDEIVAHFKICLEEALKNDAT